MAMAFIQILFLFFIAPATVQSLCHSNIVMLDGKLYTQLDDMPINETYSINTQNNTTTIYYTEIPKNWMISENVTELKKLASLFCWSKKFLAIRGYGVKTGTKTIKTCDLQNEESAWNESTSTGILLVHVPCPPGHFLAIPCGTAGYHCHAIPQIEQEEAKCRQNTVEWDGRLFSTINDVDINMMGFTDKCNRSAQSLGMNWEIAMGPQENDFNLAARFYWNAQQLITADGNAYWTKSADLNVSGAFASSSNLRILPKMSFFEGKSPCMQEILIVHRPCPPGMFLSNVCNETIHCITNYQTVDEEVFVDRVADPMHINFDEAIGAGIIVAICIFAFAIYHQVSASAKKNTLHENEHPIEPSETVKPVYIFDEKSSEWDKDTIV